MSLVTKYYWFFKATYIAYGWSGIWNIILGILF